VGNGSDELLAPIMRACAGAGTRVAYAVPTYSLYETLVALQEGESVQVPFGPDWALPAALFGADALVIVVCHPNSPWGTAVPVASIEALAREAMRLVVVDEAYVDFADESAPPLIVLHALTVAVFSMRGAVRQDMSVVKRAGSKAL